MLSIFLLFSLSAVGAGAISEPENCAKEGERYSKVYTDEYPESCCADLKEWDSGMKSVAVQDGECVFTDRLSGNPVGICINCGNGICETIEDVCRCPEDCRGFLKQAKSKVINTSKDFSRDILAGLETIHILIISGLGFLLISFLTILIVKKTRNRS